MIGAVLAVAPGTGRVARRADGLLFVPTMSGAVAWVPIIDAYLAAADADDAREAVTSAAVGAGFALDPFVMVSWHRGIELLVLGELDVHTDLPSVPRLQRIGIGHVGGAPRRPSTGHAQLDRRHPGANPTPGSTPGS